jgi:hypothetical protein
MTKTEKQKILDRLSMICFLVVMALVGAALIQVYFCIWSPTDVKQWQILATELWTITIVACLGAMFDRMGINKP